jgi:hypothetical protein
MNLICKHYIKLLIELTIVNYGPFLKKDVSPVIQFKLFQVCTETQIYVLNPGKRELVTFILPEELGKVTVSPPSYF